MPNVLAYFMLFAWPVVTVILFARLPVPKAATISIIVGYLILPKQPYINFPVLPSYGHELAAAIPALVMALVKSRSTPELRGTEPTGPQVRTIEGWLPQSLLLKICVIALVVGPFLTAVTNIDAVANGGRVLPGLRLYDGASNVLGAAMALIPFVIARKWLAHPRDHAMLLGVFCLAALVYSILALFEVRMSPQINRMVYGFFPSNWVQVFRQGGFRPSVFLEHGLRLGIFMTVAILATLGYAKLQARENRRRIWLAALWLLLTLVLCKSVGALIIAVLLAPIILLCGARLQVIFAAAIASLVLLYPMARSADLVPIDTLRSALSVVVKPGRVSSLDFRLRNEDALLERANERPLFGWGGWGRNMLYDENGRSASVTDGTWVIIFGKDGWIGYLAAFGLLTLPIVFLALRRRDDLTVASAALALVLAANLVDLIPNSGLTPLTWLMAGAIAGRLELGRAQDETPEVATAPIQSSPYRRNFPEIAARRRSTPRRALAEGQEYRREKLS